MAKIYTSDEIKIIAEGGKILARIFSLLKQEIKEGASLKYLDKLAHEAAKEQGAQPAFLGYRPGGARRPYPASICASLNDVVVHGLPIEYKLKSGDVLKIDFGVKYKGYYSDAAFTMEIGKIPAEAKNLIRATRFALEEMIRHAKPGNHLSDLGWAVERVAKKFNVGVIKGLTGHGIGKELHEDPTIYNYGEKGKGMELKSGMILALEPMLSIGGGEVIQKRDESWASKDGSLTAHFEHTIAITEKGVQILTI